MRAGFKIAVLMSSGVVHSHTLPISQYVRHNYLVSKRLGLADLDSADYVKDGIRSIDDVLNCCLNLYELVCLAIDDLRRLDFCNGDIPMAFQTIRKRVTAQDLKTSSHESNNADLMEMLSQIVDIVHCSRRRELDSNPMIHSYLVSIDTFEQWLLNTHCELTGLEEEFVDALYKLLGVEIGKWLGSHTAWSRTYNHADKGISKLDEFLMGNAK